MQITIAKQAALIQVAPIRFPRLSKEAPFMKEWS